MSSCGDSVRNCLKGTRTKNEFWLGKINKNKNENLTVFQHIYNVLTLLLQDSLLSHYQSTNKHIWIGCII